MRWHTQEKGAGGAGEREDERGTEEREGTLYAHMNALLQVPDLQLEE